MKVHNHLDLQQNQLINIVLDPKPTHPASGTQGQLYYNTLENAIYKHTGTDWVKIVGLEQITSDNGSVIIDEINAGVNLGINVDNDTLEIASDNGAVRIKENGVATKHIKDANVTTVKIADKNVTFAKIQDVPTMTVIGRISPGLGTTSAIQIINTNDLDGASGTNLATAGAIKHYIDTAIAGIGTLIGSFNANTNNIFPGTAQTKKGDYWYVSHAGNVAGVSLNIGDVVIANKANPTNTTSTDWIILETNRDQATTTVLGVVALATNAEVQAGTNNTKAITPEGLASRTATETRTGIARISNTAQALAGTDNTTIMTPLKVKALMNATVGGHTALIGNGAATNIQITHNLNTEYIIAEFFLASTKEKILVDYTISSINMITAHFATAPTTNQIRVIIKK